MNIFNITSFILSILGILNVLFCPGNSVRKSTEITHWFPQFTDYSLFSKMTIQITHIFVDLTGGSGLLQLLLVCITLSLVRHYHGLASLALVEIIFIELIKNKVSLRLQNVISVMQSGAVTAHLVSKLILPTLFSLLIFASLLYFITVIFKDKIRCRKILIILIAAVIIGISGSLTPTMIASADRPFFILKFIIVLYCILIIKDTLLTKESANTIN